MNRCVSEVAYTWPVDLTQYDRSPSLTETEQCALAKWSGATGVRGNTRAALSRLCLPLDDVSALTLNQHQHGPSRAATAVLLEVKRTQQAYWAWCQNAWLDLACRPSTHANTRSYVVAIAYLLGDFSLVHCVRPTFFLSTLARFIFGKGLFDRECGRLHHALQEIGYGGLQLERNFPSVVAAVMLENRNPHLESFSGELLERAREKYTAQARSIGKISHGLAALGILPSPLRKSNYLE